MKRNINKIRDGFRDRFPPKSRDPSPLPPGATTSSPRLNATTISAGKTKYNNVGSTTAVGTGGHGTDAAGQNPALQRAIKDHLAKIPPEEKQWFRSLAHDMTDDSILELVRKHDQSHRDRSCLRPRTELLSRVFQCLGRFTDAIAIGIQANPDVSSIIVGIARGIITSAVDFTSFFDKLTEMMDSMVDFLDPLTSYAQSAKASPVVEDCLVAVYIDLLTFFRSARRVFVGRPWPHPKVDLLASLLADPMDPISGRVRCGRSSYGASPRCAATRRPGRYTGQVFRELSK